MKTINIWTDGSCLGNPGPGGWACLFTYPGKQNKIISGSEPNTTNNYMELLAVFKALNSLKVKHVPVCIHTDSQYVIGMYCENWKAKKHRDLIRNTKSLIETFTGKVYFVHVKGHSGDPNNDIVDAEAKAEAMKLKEASLLA